MKLFLFRLSFPRVNNQMLPEPAVRAALGLAVCMGLGSFAWAQECATIRGSQTISGVPANGDAAVPSVSEDGRWVAFGTKSNNLATPDTNGVGDVVVRDGATGEFELVSVASDGTQGNGGSGQPVISGNGRRVIYWSAATNLDPRDTDTHFDVYQRDLEAKTTRLVSIRRGPGSTPTGINRWATNHDGRYVVFNSSDRNFPVQGSMRWASIYLVDMLTENFELISQTNDGVLADRACFGPAISGDGRFVAFITFSGNLGVSNPAYLPQAWVHDREDGQLRAASLRPDGSFSKYGLLDNSLALSYDGRFLAFCAFMPEILDSEWNGLIHSGSGIAVRDLLESKTESTWFTAGGQRPNHWCQNPQISMDGRFVCYTSPSTNLVPGIKEGPDQVYRYDRQTGALRLMSTSNAGEPANSGIIALSLSGDGRSVAFESFASNLVPGDAGLSQDIFVRCCERDLVGTHCAPSVSSAGCLPHLTARGAPALSQAHGFEVHASQVPPGVSAMLLVSTSGPGLEPIRGHQYLCIKPPVLATSPFQTTGTSRNLCSGTFSFDLNAYWAANPSQAPAPGSLVFLQAWCADPASGVNASLSDSLYFELAP